MKEFINSTAIEVEKLPAYGWVHLTYFIVGVLVCVLIGYLLRKKSIKTMNWILFGLGLFLLLTEIYKRLFYTYYIGQGSYQYWIFPFQMCSIPMYFCILLPFIKSEKIRNAIYVFLISYNFLGGFISFLEPSGLIHEYLFLTIHAFIWHMILVLIGVIIDLNKNIKFTFKEFRNNILLFISLCIMAFIINLIFLGKGVNMFFVGPEISSIIVFKSIATKFGWYINTPIYMLALTIGAYIFYIPSVFLSKRK